MHDALIGSVCSLIGMGFGSLLTIWIAMRAVDRHGRSDA